MSRKQKIDMRCAQDSIQLQLSETRSCSDERVDARSVTQYMLSSVEMNERDRVTDYGVILAGIDNCFMYRYVYSE